jgi:hypothetical protein
MKASFVNPSFSPFRVGGQPIARHQKWGLENVDFAADED